MRKMSGNKRLSHSRATDAGTGQIQEMATCYSLVRFSAPHRKRLDVSKAFQLTAERGKAVAIAGFLPGFPLGGILWKWNAHANESTVSRRIAKYHLTQQLTSH